MPKKPLPRWAEIVGDELGATRRRSPRRSVGLNFPPSLFSVVQRAAAGRGLSLAAYVRRAAVAIACVDLGLDYRQVMLDEPAVRPYGELTADAVSKNGLEHGAWRVLGMGEFDGPAQDGGTPRA